MPGRGSPLVALDSASASFLRDLDTLDCLSNRTHDTLHVFYMRSGQKTAEEILSNVVRKIFRIQSVEFVELIKGYLYYLRRCHLPR